MQSKSRTQTIADVPRQFAGMEDVNLHGRENAPCRPARVVRRGAIIFAGIYTAPRQANVGIAGCSSGTHRLTRGLCFPAREGDERGTAEAGTTGVRGDWIGGGWPVTALDQAGGTNALPE